MALEYVYPTIVKQHYLSRTEAFLDLGVTYANVALLLFVGISIFRRSFHEQRVVVEEQAKSLQIINLEKDKVLSIIALDLKVPISSLKQYFEMMQGVDADAAEKKALEKKLTQSLGEAQYLLSNLLLWAKNQMEVHHIEMCPVSVHQVVKETACLFKQRLANKWIKLETDVNEDLFVLADENMLKVVLRNVLNNAVKFTNLEGQIEISTMTKGGQCIIKVKDNGVGIALEKQKKIFTLNIVSSYGTANERGTGLGLNLSKDYMEKQGGKIWFESIPWEGTVFYVSLPMVTGPVKQA
uniref:sensor histidine kinase n=1 Tax=Pedobacter sp. TaxID=1411316 RepID=UPI003D7FB903